jgi:UDP-2-acetamido-2-deoxy-ribo-hexuluronate aminotransferase
MKKISMVDLKTQYENIKNEIDSAIFEVINSTAFINGPKVKEFASNLEKYLQVKHVIPVASGTDALQIALMSLDLKPGDEVITTPFTFVATVEVIALLGLKPVFVDVFDDTFTIDTTKIEEKITSKTKAIIPVHLFGQAADMEKIMEIANKHNLYVIEDIAQALGSEFIYSDGSTKKLGTIGHIGATSFFPSKNLGCFGDGGAIFTNDDTLANTLRSIANHGMKVRYYHDTIGVNSRLDSIQAAILDVKLKYLDQYNSNRRSAAEYYNNAFKNCEKIITPKTYEKSTHIYHQYTLKIINSDRDKLKNYLQEKGIPCAVYYPVPLHLQKAYAHYGYKEGDFPVSEKLSRIVLSLPMHTELDNEQLEYITSSVLEFLKNN